ncbi:MAG: ATP-binding protein, partial [Mangrovicoccus sp.]|nr:ATP-binding protein [Mangrovicoccus sp.]
YQRLRNDHARIARRDLSAETVPMTSTASSLTLIGVSGMGKTISTTRILNRYPETIVHSDPFHIVQVPWVRLEYPHKVSVKQLCPSFFDRMDALLGTDFARRYGGARSSIDGVVLQMAAIDNSHAIGLIVIDEIQHLMEARGTGRDEMLNFLVTLVNHCSTPVMLIGTPRALPLLQGAFRQARRASGLGSLSWGRMARGATWDAFVTQIWSCQWTREPSPLSDEIREVLYDESQGIVDVVIKLYLVAQLRAISRSALWPGRERLDAALLRRAARVHLALIRPMIESLRSGKGQYRPDFDDLRALDAHVREVLETAVARAAAAAASDGSLPDPILRRRSQTDTLAEALSEFGIPLDQARLMFREAEARRPGAIRDDLRAAVLALLRGEAPPAEPMPASDSARKKDDAQDIRLIAEGGDA